MFPCFPRHGYAVRSGVSCQGGACWKLSKEWIFCLPIPLTVSNGTLRRIPRQGCGSRFWAHRVPEIRGCGGCWAAAYSLPQIIEDDPRGIEWQRLPQRCILQHHWDADPELIARLSAHRFHLVTLSRHPLDVLISILHFASVNPSTTAYWLGKRGGSEAGIANATPRSPAFLEYAVSPRAKLLLSISPSWATVKDCLVVRYESLVQDPIRQLSMVCDLLRPAPVEAVQYAAHANTLEKQAQPGRQPAFLAGATESLEAIAHRSGGASHGGGSQAIL